ncbi:DNA cytosine methyltransferase [Stenotrophomonas maltophilia]|uniref:DNA cytosine methyltransferase n=1 Tax=Stenotrophomonas maltophilia TaxID=40324 RepID=UPI003D7E6DFA
MRTRNAKANSAKSGLTVIDLFCGAGGLSEGLRQAGFLPVAGIDFDRNAIATYAKNHPESLPVLADIAEVDGRKLLRELGLKGVDLIAGGPSCQGFSTHGKRMQDDPRNFLFKHFVRLVNEIRPKMFLMENVRGMLTYGKGEFRRQIEDAFMEIGYRTSFSQVLAADYGVPQLRHRVLFLGTRLEDVDLRFPEPTHGPVAGRPYISVEEAIGDLPLMGSDFLSSERAYLKASSGSYQKYSRKSSGANVTLHVGRPLSDQAKRLAKYIKQGSGLRTVPDRVLPERFRRMRTISNGQLRRDCTTLYHRLDPKKPAYTVTCNYKNVASGPFLHPWEDRAISHREAARFMSFPDSYEFVGSCIPRQIGNAVPPLLAKAVGAEIAKSINGQT